MTYSQQDYTSLLKALLPNGAAWQGEVLHQLLEGWAAEFARLQTRIEQLDKEADPSQCSELLTDYERELNLPSNCMKDKTQTFHQRRQAVVDKLQINGLPSLDALHTLAGRLGLNVTISEDGFNLIFTEQNATITRTRFGVSSWGDRWWQASSASIVECVFRQITRADRALIYRYS